MAPTPSARSRHARRALHNTSLQGLAQAWYLLLRVVYVVVFARLLGVEAYGHYNYAQTWYLIVLSVAGWGTHEWLLSRWQRVDSWQRQALLDTGLSLRIILGGAGTLLVLLCARFLEPEASLQWLIVIYAQGVLLRSLTAWFQALFTSHERSELVLYTSVPISLLEVALLLGLAWSGQELPVIALAQTACWWLGLAIAWLTYRGKLGAPRPRFQPEVAREFLIGGALLASASALLAWMGPGMLVAVRHLLGEGPALGEAAFVIQVVLMLGQALRMITNAALPFLTRPGSDITHRQRGFATRSWYLTLYLGSAGYLLGTVIAPALVRGLLGEPFEPAGLLLARFSWILIPLCLIQILRLLLIGRGLYRTFLLSLILGALALALALVICTLSERVSLDILFASLGLAYSTSVGIMLWALSRIGVSLLPGTLGRSLLICAASLSVGLGFWPGVPPVAATWGSIGLLLLATLYQWRRQAAAIA